MPILLNRNQNYCMGSADADPILSYFELRKVVAMYRKPDNLGHLLLRYWIVILLALVVFGYFSGFLPRQLSKIEKSLIRSTPAESTTDSLYKAEQGAERREILKD